MGDILLMRIVGRSRGDILSVPESAAAAPLLDTTVDTPPLIA
jgi:hypothetical protein